MQKARLCVCVCVVGVWVGVSVVEVWGCMGGDEWVYVGIDIVSVLVL